MKTDDEERTEAVEHIDVDSADLQPYMREVINDLLADGKYPAVNTYTSTLNSFLEFSGGKEASLPMNTVFTPGRLKAYEDWLLLRGLSLNTVSTYTRTLKAVYNRWMPIGSLDHNPKLFDGIYTKVVSQTKRALTDRQMNRLMFTDTGTLTGEQRRVLAYFLLMFMFRGMPFIDLAHLRKRDLQGNRIVYRRHKTGKLMTVHILKEAVPLLKEFRDKNPDSIYLFPILNISLRGGWEQYKGYQDALRYFNKSLCKLMRQLLPGIKVSSYTSRHTWATLSFHLGTTPAIISQSLGHSSFHVTETYLKPFENDKVDKANYMLMYSVRKCKRKDDLSYNTL